MGERIKPTRSGLFAIERLPAEMDVEIALHCAMNRDQMLKNPVR